LSYTSVDDPEYKRSIFNINLLQTLEKHYKLMRKTENGAFYVPSKNTQ
jgi:hypothetical protein